MMGLEHVPADKRGVPFVPTQEIFRLPMNDGEIRMMAEIFSMAQKQNPEWAKDARVDRLYSKIGFLFMLGKVMFLPPAEHKPYLDGLLKLHDILSKQVLELKKLEMAAQTKARVTLPGGQLAPNPPPPVPPPARPGVAPGPLG
jgi:hypothetical protein